MLIVVQARLAGLDPTPEEASADLGAGERATEAAVEAVDEAVINAIVAGEDVATVKPRGGVCRAIDCDQLAANFAADADAAG